MLCIFETVTLPLRASVSCQTWGPTWTWFSKGGDSILAGSSRALRSGRVLCDPGQVAFLLCLGKCVGEPSGTPPCREGDFILSPRGLLQERPLVAQPMPGPQGLLSLHTVGAHRVGAQ